MTTTDTSNDLRFGVPLYTLTDASRYLLVPRSTLETWARGYERHPTARPVHSGPPIITAFARSDTRGSAELPFVGIAEAYVLSAFRRAGVPMQRIRPSIDWLIKNVGPHALASRDLFTDGVEVLWQFAERQGPNSTDGKVVQHLIAPRLGQYVFKDIVQHYLQNIRFDMDEYASSIRLPQYGDAEVVLDPYRGFGHPIFSGSGVKVEDAVGRLRAGETIESVAEDFDIPEGDLRDALDILAV
ncbi:DUF433 domain-containing protein [Mycolicibacterium brumae]|uniref:DUF433 domain-containing protein n=1 Tax=Mycolicibacterium brumae TaxID=85968 RepID=A0A2G5PC91_9MYCO|nr:DUF433 domain-containing protein [Mycolicibacterium brumae]MCV7193114.1 DUF433 domain-containing protein [Mycolicibacterium brumae]PIB75959.1 DUF433 domain-containing protein [Mycolicibacterium brumae]RWA16551.1 hypothetical protein MBRU_07445 [Mycolicibacterium brumae DSM 44177]UWW09770.1 DUF433 domain-containing protein [Mycolicibacterium brumae]